MSELADDRTAALVMLSSRGPYQFERSHDEVVRTLGPGGLITALLPSFTEREMQWIALARTPYELEVARSRELIEEKLRFVGVDDATFHRFYDQISNGTLWFMLSRIEAHEQLGDDALDAGWASYREVNRSFAEAAPAATSPNGVVRVEDYQLTLVPAMLRELRPDVRILHVTYCPWQEPDQLLTLGRKVAEEVVTGMLGADLVAFLSERWTRNFLACCQHLGYSVDVDGARVTASDGRVVHVRTYPLGVDGTALNALAATVAGVHRPGGQQLIMRADRIEPAKNVVRGLLAYELLLERHARFRGAVHHRVFVYDSRLSTPGYLEYRDQIVEIAERINDRFTTEGWTALELRVANDHAGALANFALADVIVVNPTWDGMNLIVKEAVAVNRRDAVVILSENAGAAAQLGHAALLVDPFDVEALTNALVRALEMSQHERSTRLIELQDASTSLPPVEWFDAAISDLLTLASAGQ